MAVAHVIRRALLAGLGDAADPERAVRQQAYMKSEMPFVGVATPRMRRVANAVFEAHPLSDAVTWESAILHLWRRAQHREERYAALELLHHRAYRDWITPERFVLLDELVVTGAWWDYVDGLAAHAFGSLLAGYPKPTRTLLRRWSKDAHLWRRRTAILAQLRRKEATDWAFLTECIEPSVGEPPFFLRKAIGWALRQYAYTDPSAVLAYVDANRPRLSALTVREALRGIDRGAKPGAMR